MRVTTEKRERKREREREREKERGKVKGTDERKREWNTYDFSLR